MSVILLAVMMILLAGAVLQLCEVEGWAFFALAAAWSLTMYAVALALLL